VHGVSFDGTRVWFASDDALRMLDPASGRVERSIALACDGGTAFDGHYLYQLTAAGIQKVEPATGAVVATIPAPEGDDNSGLTWAEGTLWMGQYRSARIVQIDPQSGKVLRTIQSNRFVTGVTWVDGELWHGTWDDEASDIRRVDLESGKVLEQLTMPRGTGVSGLESDGAELFYAGGGSSGKVRAVRRPKRAR
jgi:glutamine cyclotransferase